MKRPFFLCGHKRLALYESESAETRASVCTVCVWWLMECRGCERRGRGLKPFAAAALELAEVMFRHGLPGQGSELVRLSDEIIERREVAGMVMQPATGILGNRPGLEEREAAN